jgi:hypothetical protein
MSIFTALDFMYNELHGNIPMMSETAAALETLC